MTPEEVSFASRLRTARSKAASMGGLGLDPSAIIAQAGQVARGVQTRGVIGAFVPSITIRTQVSPDVTADMTAAPPGQKGVVAGGEPFTNTLLGIVKPAFYAQTAAGPVSIEPYGRPTPGKFLWVFVIGSALLLAAAGFGSYSLIKSFVSK